MIRVLILPSILSSLAGQDPDEIFDQLKPYMREDFRVLERSRESLDMVFRWAHEAQELAQTHRDARAAEDSIVEP